MIVRYVPHLNTSNAIQTDNLKEIKGQGHTATTPEEN